MNRKRRWPRIKRVAKNIFKWMLRLSPLGSMVIALIALFIAIGAWRSANEGTEGLQKKLGETIDSLGSVNRQMGKTVTNLNKLNVSQRELIDQTNQAAKGLEAQVGILNKNTGELTFIAGRQWVENQQVPFLSLCMLDDAGNYDFIIYFDSVDLITGKVVDFYVFNSGSSSCRDGLFDIEVGEFLKVECLKSFEPVMVFPSTNPSDSTWISGSFSGIPEPTKHPVWSSRIDEKGKRIIQATNSFQYVASFRFSIKDSIPLSSLINAYGVAPLRYRITATGAEGNQWRELYLCFDKGLIEILRDDAWKRNMFDERFE